jgi:Big-like domain-containing protein
MDNGPSASPILNQTVTQATSAATLTSSLNPSTQGRAVTFTAEITSPTAIPSGPVTFTAGKTTLATVELQAGKATFTTSTLGVGATTVTVKYPWNSDIAASSASVTQTVTK